jgi:hypothetical protein
MGVEPTIPGMPLTIMPGVPPRRGLLLRERAGFLVSLIDFPVIPGLWNRVVVVGCRVAVISRRCDRARNKTRGSKCFARISDS